VRIVRAGKRIKEIAKFRFRLPEEIRQQFVCFSLPSDFRILVAAESSLLSDCERW
jgi:hypothetical protein